MIGALEHLLEVLARLPGGDPLACTGRTARTAVGFGSGLLPLLESLQALGALLVHAASLAAT
jgi:hypothetical protein